MYHSYRTSLFALASSAMLAAFTLTSPAVARADNSKMPMGKTGEKAGAPAMTEKTMGAGKQEAVGQNLFHGTRLLGAEVLDPSGEAVGRIDQIVLDRSLDHALFTVVALKREPRDNVAIPLTALQEQGPMRFAIDVQAADLHKAPSAPHAWSAELTKEGFDAKVDSYFRDHSPRYRQWAQAYETPTMGGRETMPAMSARAVNYQRLTKLVGLKVNAKNAEDVGNIEDVIFDLQDGYAVYGVLSLTSPRDHFALVPWSAVQIRPRLANARVDIDRRALTRLAFTPTTFPNLADRAYATRIYQTFDREPYWQVYGYVPKPLDPKAAWAPESTFNRLFVASQVRTIKGTVESVGTFTPEPGAADGLRIRVKTSKGELITVLGGPKAVANREGLKPYFGETVTVTGSDTTFEGRKVILATDINSGGVDHHLRDNNGRPVWPMNEIE